MKFLCLAYGDEDGWNSLGEDEKLEVLSHDEVIELVSNTPCARARGVIEIRPFWEVGRDGA